MSLQVTFALRSALHSEYDAETVEDAYRALMVHHSDPLRYFNLENVQGPWRIKRIEQAPLRDLTDEQVSAVLASLPSMAELVKACTPRGSGKGIKTNKPKEGGFIAYVWRMARFHSGEDMTMPVTAFYDSDDAINKAVGARVSSLAFPQKRRILDALDALADRLVRETGGNEYRGAARWGRALGYL